MTFVPVEDRLIAQSGIRDRVPGFTAGHLHALHRLEVTRDPESDALSVELSFLVAGAPDLLLVLRVVDASGTLPALAGGLNVGELLIEDLSTDQLEGVCYYVHDEGGPLSLYCRALELIVRPA